MAASIISLKDLDEAIAITNRRAHTFALATRLLPHDLRDDVYLLYFVCRTLDDLVDHHYPEAATRLFQVRAWAQGAPAIGREERILEGLITRHPAMPRLAVADFCDGQLQDLHPIRIATESELDEYAYRVAGTVGRLMVGLLGPRAPEADASARALGIAMQRTNILRDIDEDLATARVYVPSHTLRLAHVRDLAADDRRLLLRIEIAIADDWYERGLRVADQVEHGRLAVRAAATMYHEILRQIERNGLGAIRPQRAVVSAPRKAELLVEAVMHG